MKNEDSRRAGRLAETFRIQQHQPSQGESGVNNNILILIIYKRYLKAIFQDAKQANSEG
jgi:hypothetical protein